MPNPAMTISELIVELQALKCEHGDLPVFWQACTGKAVPLVLHLGTEGGAERVEVAPKEYPC